MDLFSIGLFRCRQYGCRNHVRTGIPEFHPVLYKGEWVVNLGDAPRRYQTLRAAREYIKRCYEQRDRCLYANCLLEGEDIPGMGVGFRFCERHARNAKKVLRESNKGTTSFKRKN